MSNVHAKKLHIHVQISVFSTKMLISYDQLYDFIYNNTLQFIYF